MQPEFQNNSQPQTPEPQPPYQPPVSPQVAPVNEEFAARPPVTQPEPPQNTQPQFQPPVQPLQQGQDPGKGLAIAGIVLAFFFSLLGLILSIVAKKKSKTAGFDNSLATIGIILNAVFLVLQALFIVFLLVTVVFVAKDNIEQKSSTNDSYDLASNVYKKTELYNINHDAYPKTIAELKSDAETDVSIYPDVTFVDSPITSNPGDPNTLEFYTCTDTSNSTTEYGNKIGYWDYLSDHVAYLYTLDVTATSDCSLTNQ